MNSTSTKTALIDGYLMKVGNPADHENVKATSRTTVYFLETFTDGSQALYYDNGYSIGHYCSVPGLKWHLKDLQHIGNKKNLIPEDWTITDPDFFKSLAII